VANRISNEKPVDMESLEVTSEASGQTVKHRQERHMERILPEQLDPELVRKLPLEFLKKQCAVPVVLEDGRVGVALAEPSNIEAFDAISSVLGCHCLRFVCPADEIEQAISQCYYQSEGPDHGETDESGPRSGDIEAASVQTPAEDLLNVDGKAPVVKLVNKIFFQAVNNRASDIHVEPYENEARIRFRVDGVLHDVHTLPRHQVAALVSRLKVMSNLNIAERRLPQDGHSRIKIGDKLVDIRVSAIPTLGGERVVLRLLDKSNDRFALNEIGFAPRVFEQFKRLMKLTHGIVLLTGPTGSGKTTTLYAALSELNSEERNILTVEDPIEYQIPGIGQMQVKPKIDLTFANCLRHILRQDPDIIMIGEIRDAETARIAIQASLTGHLVLSTLHTNDSASAVTRLIDMGIEPYLISSSVVAVMAQRLVRVICPHCKTSCTPDEQTARLMAETAELQHGEVRLSKGAGCEHCLQTGYTGRSGIFELLVVDEQIQELILRRTGSQAIKQLAIQRGISTLRQDGFRKAAVGQTTIEEVFRVTQDDVLAGPETITYVNG
jgi:general secretion pathway protein E